MERNQRGEWFCVNSSRKKAAIKSTVIGMINSIITLLLTFIIRTYVLTCFSADYVGLYTLLSQTIGILVGIDAGLSSSVLIKIHKPIAENDIVETRRIYYLIRVIYHFRSLLVLVLGAVIGFFIPRLVNTTIPLEYIYKCYYAYLIINSLNYWYIYDYFMLETVQQRYIGSFVVCIINVIGSLINIALMKTLHSYIVYIIVTALTTLLTYIVCSIIFKKIHSEFYQKYKFDKGIFTEFKDLLGMSVHTLSNTVIKHSDTILMSTVVDLASTGYYSNYNLIISGVNTLITQLTASVKDPLRNLTITANLDMAGKSIKRITYLYGVIMGSMCVCFCTCADLFVEIFWGNTNIIDSNATVYLMAISALILTMSSPLVDFYYVKELYRVDKLSPVMECVINLLLSLTLGFFIGVDGIIIGTIVTYLYRVVTRTFKIKNNLHISQLANIILYVLENMAAVVIISFILRTIVNVAAIRPSIMAFLLVGVFSFVISVILLGLIRYKQDEYCYFKSFLLSPFERFIKHE